MSDNNVSSRKAKSILQSPCPNFAQTSNVKVTTFNINSTRGRSSNSNNKNKNDIANIKDNGARLGVSEPAAKKTNDTTKDTTNSFLLASSNTA